MFLRARAADSHCEIIRFPVRFCSSSGFVREIEFQIPARLLSRGVVGGSPSERGIADGFWRDMTKSRKNHLAERSRSSVHGRGLEPQVVSCSGKDGQPIAERDE